MTDKPSLDLIILHYAIKNKKYMLELTKSIKLTYFTVDFQDFYAVMVNVFTNPNIRDVLSIPVMLDFCDRNKLGHKRVHFQNIYNHIINIQYDGSVLTDGDFGYFLKLFKDRHNSKILKDAVIKASRAIHAKEALPEINEILETSIKEIHSIYKGEVFDEGSVGADVQNIYDEYRFIANEPHKFKGVPSGFPSLDILTNGFFGGELIIMAGQEGSGKSLVCMNMAINAWLGSNSPDRTAEFTNDGHNIVYFSLEMPRSNRGEFTSGAYLNKRIMSCMAGVSFSDMRKGMLSEIEEKTFSEVCKFAKKYDEHKKFYVVDIPRGATLEDIELKYLELKEKFSIDLVVIDYMGLMAGAGDQDEADWEAQGKIAAGLHEFARMYNVPVITPVQVNRSSGTNHSLNKQNYNTTRIARSAMITQNANIVLQIGCRDQEEQYSDMPLYIVKMRDAPKGIITFTKDFNRMRVIDNQNATIGLDTLGEFEDLGTDA